MSASRARPRRRGARRRLLKVLAWAIAAALGTLVLAWLALQSDTFRAMIAGRVSIALERAVGLRLEVRDWHFEPWTGRLELEAPTLAAEDGSVLAQAEHIEVMVVLPSLLRRRVHLRSLILEAPTVDLSVPLPRIEGSGEDGERRDFAIDRLVVRAGRVLGNDPPDAVAPWIESWSITDLELNGFFRSEQLVADVETASVHLAGEPIGRQSLLARGRLSGPAAGPFTLDAVSVEARGLELEAAVAFDTDPAGLRDISFRLSADMSRLLPQHTTAGTVEANGRFGHPPQRGHIEVQARGFPAELLEPWLGSGALERLDRASHLDMDVSANLEPGAANTTPGPATVLSGTVLSGTTHLVWRTGARVIADGHATLIEASLDSENRLAPATIVGDIDLVASNVPVEILEPWMPVDAIDSLGPAPADLDLEIRLRVDHRQALPLQAEVHLALDQHGHTLASGKAQATGPAFDELGRFDPRRLEGVAELRAPALPGRILGPWLGQEWLDPVMAGDTTLAVDATARAALAADPPFEARVAMTWRRGGQRLLEASAHTTHSRLDQEGALDLDRLAVHADLEIQGLSGQMLEPVLGAEIFSRAAAAGTEIDGRVSADFELGAPMAAAAELEAVWRRDREPLLAASARTLDGPGVTVHFDASLLPSLAGTRRVSGQLHARDWQIVAGAEIENAELELELPDIAAAVAELQKQWPDLGLDQTPELLLRGRLESTARIEGPIGAPRAEATAHWLRPGASVRLRGSGQPLDLSGEIFLEAEQFDLDIFDQELLGTVVASGSIRGAPAHYRARFEMQGTGLGLIDQGIVADTLDLAFDTDGRTVHLLGLDAGRGDARLSANGEVDLGPPPAGRLELDLHRPLHGMERATIDLTLADGVVRAASRELSTALGPGELVASLPVSLLRSYPALEPHLERWGLLEPIQTDDLATVRVVLPELDIRSAEPAEHDPELTEPAFRALVRDLQLSLRFDPADLGSAVGALAIGSLSAEIAGHRVETVAPLDLRLDDGRLDSGGVRLTIDQQPIDLRAKARLVDDWQRLEAPLAIIEDLEVQGLGAVDLARFEDSLLGGVGNGKLELRFDLRGPPQALSGQIEIDGPEARVEFLYPYVSRFDSPRLTLGLQGGVMTLRSGTARLNEGTLELSGRWGLEDGLLLDTLFDDVRYRLDYGLSAVLAGELQVVLPAPGSTDRGKIGGRLEVERGLVRRDVDLDRALLAGLFVPATLSGEVSDVAANTDLDIAITTRDGVNVRNNVADLRALWVQLSVRGTLAEPTVDGVVDVEPGGVISAYGQTFRLDRATVTLRGQAGAQPHLDLSATSSLQDPTVARDAPSSLDPFAPQRVESDEQGPAAVGSVLASGLASYYGERVAAGLGRTLSGPSAGGFIVRPVLVFNESDPDARLTVGRNMTDHVMVAASFNLRNAERRTYMMEFHDLRSVPSLRAMLFSNELDNPGITVQQNLDFGGGAVDDEPRVGDVRIEAPPGISRRGLRDAIEIEKRQPFPSGSEFDVEVDAAEYLRRRGYSTARVSVSTFPADKGKSVDLAIAIEPGPRSDVRFEGLQPPARLRDAIGGLYRADFYERASIEEMRMQTIRALRSQGYPEPRVEVFLEEPQSDPEVRTIVVRSEAERRLDLGPPVFQGVEPEIAALLGERFTETQARIELAVGAPAADRAVLGSLRDLAFPNAAIVSREVSGNGKRLTVTLAPGTRLNVGSVSVSGIEQAQANRLEGLVELHPGDPPSADRLARDAVRIENDLGARGYGSARVEAVVIPAPSGDSVSVDYQVVSGPRQELTDIELQGLTATNPRWAEGVAGVEPGAVLNAETLAAVQRSYLETGLFNTVAIGTAAHADGGTTLIVDLDEHSRYSFAYGLRWESDVGAGVVLDVLDRNLLGRGVHLGLRTLYNDNLQFGRLFATAPRIFGSRSSLESFAQISNETEFGLREETLEASLQFSRPLRRHGTGRVYGRYRTSHFTEEDPDPFFPLDVTVISPYLGVQYIFDNRREPVPGRNGLFSSVDLSGSDETIGSDFDYLRLYGQVSYTKPIARIGRRTISWAQALSVGLANTYGRTEFLLPDVRFFAGGEYSVRGYPTDSLGPTEDLGGITRPIGGEALMIINQELRVPLAWRFSGVVFFDIGNVWPSTSDFGSDLSKSLGLGLRATSPVGLLRLDIARPLDRRETEPEYKIYVGLGQVF